MTTSPLSLRARFPRLAAVRVLPAAITAALAAELMTACSSAPAHAPVRAPAERASPTLNRDTPEERSAAVLRTERQLAQEAAGRPFRDALRAMFRPDVMMPAPATRVLTGVDAVLGAFATSPDTSARVQWTPIRVGLSSDGTHAYTVGVGSLVRLDGTRGQFKYLAYWIREQGVWRVAAWRRRPVNADVALDSTMLAPHLPVRLVSASVSNSVLATMRHELMAAEQGFSDLAQRVGVGNAFLEMGADDAVNVGPPTLGAFVVGARQIAASVAGNQSLGAPSTITWKADTALIAPGGDLGITFGVIRPKPMPADNPDAGASFFTIWRRASPGAPWRYVAE